MKVKVIFADKYLPKLKKISPYHNVKTTNGVIDKGKHNLQREKSMQELLKELVKITEESIGEINSCECEENGTHDK